MEKMPTGLRKRQQIARANRVMFLWVAGASVIIGVAVVVSGFLVQKIWFTNKVISQKTQTQSTLQHDISVLPQLRDNIRVLDTSDALKSVALSDSDRPIQSVLDALPSDANDTALGSSLTTKIIGGVPGVTLESITVNPVNAAASGDMTSSNGLNKMTFTMSVSVPSSKVDALRQVLLRSEKSIRVLMFTGISLDAEGTKQVMTLTGYAYYAPPVTLQLQDKVVH